MQFRPHNEHQDRIAKIIKWIGMGWNSPRIVKYAIEEEKWGIVDKTIRRYFTLARKYIREEIKVDRQMEFNKALLQYEILFEKGIDYNNLKVSLDSLNSKLKFLQIDKEQELKFLKKYNELYGIKNTGISKVNTVIFTEITKEDVENERK